MLTAAHCINETRIENGHRVRLGATHIDSDEGATYRIDRMVRHADWNELTSTISEIKPGEVWITHGNEEALLRWCELSGQKARALSLVGYDADEGEG